MKLSETVMTAQVSNAWGSAKRQNLPEEGAERTESLLQTRDWERVAREADFKPGKMATLCAISERHLQRVFKRYLNCTPSRGLRVLQCRLAKDLIAQGYSSKAAAAELKFATDSHFCREFKKVFGAPPQNFAPNHFSYLGIETLNQIPGLAPAVAQ